MQSDLGWSNLTMNDTDLNVTFALNPSARRIWQICPPIIITFGLIGNVLSAWVMFRHRVMKKSPTSVYLGLIAIYDNLYLCCYVCDWLSYGFSINIRYWTNCRSFSFFYFYTSETSSQWLAMMTFGRTLLVIFPMRSKNMLTRRVAFISAAVVGVALFALDLHFFWTTKHPGDITIIDTCIATEGNEVWFYTIFPAIDSSIYSFIPFIVLVICNSIIIYKTVQSKQSAKTSLKKSMNILLILVSLSFFVFTSPNVIKNIIMGTLNNQINDPVEKEKWDMIIAFTDNIVYINHALNFYLYVISGATFRRYVRECFCPTPAKEYGLSNALSIINSHGQATRNRELKTSEIF